MADAMTKVLLPCPHCGAAPHMFSGGTGRHYVRCDACPHMIHDRGRENVIAAWNRRAAPQPAASDVPHDVVRVEDKRTEFGMAKFLEGCSESPYSYPSATPAPSTSTEEALRAENAKWGRADLAKGLAALDGISLRDVLTSSGDAANMTNWREYLGRADDLLAHLSLAAIIKERVNGPRVSVNIDDL